MKNCEPFVLAPALACAQSDEKERREGTTWAAAHHGKKEGTGMLHGEGFVFEFFPIDGFTTSSYITCKR